MTSIGFRLIKIIFILISLMLIEINSFGAAVKKNISILMFSDELRYIQTKDGFIEELKRLGYSDKKVNYTVESAQANKAKAAEYVKTIKARKPDLIFTLGTTATQAVLLEIKDIPVVFSSVYDPVDSGIANAWKSSGNNCTGNSSKISMSTIFEKVNLFHKPKKIGILYTPGEKNSEAQVKDLQDVQREFKFKVVPVPVSKSEDLDYLLPQVLNSVDSLYMSGSNLVSGSIKKILELSYEKKIITVTHLRDLVERGVLLGVCANPFLEGKGAAQYALKIFNGKPPSTLPISTPQMMDVIINTYAVKSLGISIPSAFESLKSIQLDSRIQ